MNLAHCAKRYALDAGERDILGKNVGAGNGKKGTNFSYARLFPFGKKLLYSTCFRVPTPSTRLGRLNY